MDGKRIILLGFCLCLALQGAWAQSDDFGVWTSVTAKKKLSKTWTLSAEGEYRTRDGISATDRWSGALGVTYRLTSWLKADAAYTYLYSNEAEEVTKKGNIVPAYWYSRHRVSASLTGSVDWGRFTFSLRERWQYTYRPECYVPKYDGDDGSRKDDEQVKGKGENVLRSRLKAEYNIAHSPFTPYASCELYHNGDGLDKSRWTIGSEYKISKQHSVELYYRYQDKRDADATDTHVLGIGYTIKF